MHLLCRIYRKRGRDTERGRERQRVEQPGNIGSAITMLNRIRTGVVARRAGHNGFAPGARSQELYCGAQIICREFLHEASWKEKRIAATHFISCFPICSMASTLFRANASLDGCVRTWVDHTSMICGVDCCGFPSFAALSHGHKHADDNNITTTKDGEEGQQQSTAATNLTRTATTTQEQSQRRRQRRRQPKLTAGTSR